MNDAWRALTAQEMAGDDFDAQLPFGHFAPTVLQSALIGLARRTVLKRGACRRPMTRLILSLGAGKIDVRFRGAAYRLRGDDNLIEYGLLLNPPYNGQDIDFLIADAAENANFLDLGSNIGLYSLPLALSAPEGRTIAIDANPRMAALLGWNANATGLSNLTMIHAGISDASGRASLSIRKDDMAIVSIVEDADGDIPIRTLSSIVHDAGIKTIHGLKIDIEGHEDRAMVPFLDSAPSSLLPRRIVIEHIGTADYPGCTAAFDRLGYHFVGRTRNNSHYLLKEG